jgi:Holliday junction resolvase RusA-like endonuclease
VIAFTVYGVAQPAGSKRIVPAGGRPGGRPLIIDDAKHSRPWKKQVAKAAAVHVPAQPLDGPLKLEVLFVMPRPKGHHGTGRNAAALKPSAPQWPTVKPDTTKLLRAVEDALTDAKLWRDDAQIVIQTAMKTYGDPARCEITVRPVAAQLSIHEKEIAA